MFPKDKQKQFDEWGFYIVEKEVDADYINTLAFELYKEYLNAKIGQRFLPRMIKNNFNGVRYKIFIKSNIEN